jgi:hypothetical protein
VAPGTKRAFVGLNAFAMSCKGEPACMLFSDKDTSHERTNVCIRRWSEGARANRGRGVSAALAAHDVDYLFANPGTDFPPIVEAYSRAKQSNIKVPLALVFRSHQRIPKSA